MLDEQLDFDPIRSVLSVRQDNQVIIEWRTVGLGILIYVSWGLVLVIGSQAPIWLASPAAALILCWHTHFQHECIHGHPTSRQWINDIIASVPLSLWIPYKLYRSSHLAHHASPHLTDPVSDPESFYVTKDAWKRLPRPQRAILIANQTLAGRLTIGPFLCVFGFWRDEFQKILAGDTYRLWIWCRHICLSVLILAGLTQIGIGPIAYGLWFIVPSVSLTLLRSFIEHQQASTQEERTLVIESNAFFGLLFLNNNFHSVHHLRPALAWYQIPGHFNQHREEILRNNRFAYIDGYRAVFKRWFLKPKSHPVHVHRGKPTASLNSSKKFI